MFLSFNRFIHLCQAELNAELVALFLMIGTALSIRSNSAQASASDIEKPYYSIDTVTPVVGYSRLQLSSTARLKMVTGPLDPGSHS